MCDFGGRDSVAALMECLRIEGMGRKEQKERTGGKWEKMGRGLLDDEQERSQRVEWI